MICADSLLNLSTHDTLSTRLVARLMGNRAPGIGYLEPFMIRNRSLARRQVDRMLAWDIEKIVLAHGAVLAPPSVGDLVAVLDLGAYGFTESMPYFLSHAMPAEVIARAGEAALIRPRLEPIEWLDRQLLPDSLS